MTENLFRLVDKPQLKNDQSQAFKNERLLRDISSAELVSSLKKLVKEERALLNQVLDHLEEIERRRLYLKRGYPSLFEYCVKELGYSESAAQRRISSMRLSKEIPEIKEKLSEGKLNLTTISLAQSFLRKEKAEKTYTSAQKLELLESLEDKSKREVEKKLIELSPNTILPKERERVLKSDLFEIRVQLNQEQMNKLNRLKELRADLQTTSQALEWLLDRALKQVDPMYLKISEKQALSSNPHLAELNYKESFDHASLKIRECREFHNLNSSKEQKSKRYIKKSVKSQIWHKADGQCEFIDKETGRRCGSKTNLQIDHIQPIGMGGSDEPKNLRLLCQPHNLLVAVRSYGAEKMSPFIRISD